MWVRALSRFRDYVHGAHQCAVSDPNTSTDPDEAEDDDGRRR
jgi:hypothetical protein